MSIKNKMDIKHKIKSSFKGAKVHPMDGALNSVEVKFSGSQSSVSITESSDGSLSVCYPSLVRDGCGGYKAEDSYSEKVLIEGVFWVLKKVKKNGLVKPEIMD